MAGTERRFNKKPTAVVSRGFSWKVCLDETKPSGGGLQAYRYYRKVHRQRHKNIVSEPAAARQAPPLGPAGRQSLLTTAGQPLAMVDNEPVQALAHQVDGIGGRSEALHLLPGGVG